MVRYVCGRLGWDPEQLRGYRCAIQHPFYGAQVCMVFDALPAPALESGASIQ